MDNGASQIKNLLTPRPKVKNILVSTCHHLFCCQAKYFANTNCQMNFKFQISIIAVIIVLQVNFKLCKNEEVVLPKIDGN